MTEDELCEHAVTLLTEATGQTDADRWWAIEQLAGLCRDEPQLAGWLVEEFGEWADDEEVAPSEWIPVAEALADLSTRWPAPDFALVWIRLAWERDEEVLRHVREADRLASFAPEEDDLRALVDGLSSWLLAGEGRTGEALERARRCLQGLGPDQDLEALVADLLEVEETAASGATWAAAALQEAQGRGEPPAEDLRWAWARLHWTWMRAIGQPDSANRRELAGILRELASHPSWLPDEERDFFAVGFARLSQLCGLNEQALGWLAQAPRTTEEPVLKAEAGVVRAEALFGLGRVRELADSIRGHARVVASLGDAAQRGRLAAIANAVARAQLDWEGADRILDGMDPDVLDPDGVAIQGELDEINRRAREGHSLTTDVDALVELARRSRSTVAAENEGALVAFAALVSAGLGEQRSEHLSAQAEAITAEDGGTRDGPGIAILLKFGELTRLARVSPPAAMDCAQALRDSPEVRRSAFLLLVVVVLSTSLQVQTLGRYREGLDSVAEGLLLCDEVIVSHRSSRERSRMRHFQSTLVELGLVAAEATGDKRAIAELIEFQRFQSMPVAKQEPDDGDVPFDRISVLLAGGAEDYQPDDGDLTLTASATTLPWLGRFSNQVGGSSLHVPC